jgi:DNA-binding NarL/FixJ family response regulator
MAKSSIRVLVVDDHEPFRRFVGSTLAQKPELQIVGEISDGLKAVSTAGETQPDLILLDIGLPTLNGIEAARRIRKLSPASKILFFSENRSRDIVEEALRTGAVGYVAKSDAARELLAAIEAVLQGKQFVSSSLSRPHLNADGQTRTPTAQKFARVLPPTTQIDGHHDAVFYSDDQQLLDRLSGFVKAALNAGNAAIVVATSAHRESLMQSLEAYGGDMVAAVQQGRYITMDAADTISSFMVNGMPDSVRFLRCFAELIAQATNAALEKHPRIAVFGEAADLLWKQDNAEAAIKVEKLGAQLSKTYDVDILCGYSLGIQRVIDEEVLQRICAEHSAVYRD